MEGGARNARRTSVSTRDSSELSSQVPGPVLTQPHTRRVSRLDNPNAFNMNRRMSMYRRPSIAGSQRTDVSHSFTAPVKLQNTYRLGPDDDDKFNACRVEKALASILESFLEGEEYDAKKCSQMAQNLTDHIKSRVKEMHFPRYKLVCNVLLGQNGAQCMESASRCVWNTSTDNFATASFKTSTMFAVATVYALYFE